MLICRVDQRNPGAGPLVATSEQSQQCTDEKIQNNHFQNKMDNLAEQIKEAFAPFTEFNQWLEENNQEDFFEHLASYLVKLPLRSARNILSGLYTVISTALHTSIHPIEGSHEIAKSIIPLLASLIQPEVWPKLGGGTIGTLAGQSLVLGNPISLMGLAIGGALLLGGISTEAIIAAVRADDGNEFHDLKEKVKHHAQNLPDTFLLGFFTGMLFGGMRRAIQSKKPVPIDTKDHLDKFSFEKVNNVAQYGHADWSGHIKTVSNLTLEKAKAIAANDSSIDYFFYMRQDAMYLGGIEKGFTQGDAVFFSGKPHWGSAWCADGYIKA